MAFYNGISRSGNRIALMSEECLRKASEGVTALLFDPFSVEAIDLAVGRIAIDERLRAELDREGAIRLKVFSCEHTAKASPALHRRAARRPVTDEDRWLLSLDWMKDSNPPRKATS